MTKEDFYWVMEQLGWSYHHESRTLTNPVFGFEWKVYWVTGYPYFHETPIKETNWLTFTRFAEDWLDVRGRRIINCRLSWDLGILVDYKRKKNFFLPWTNKMGVTLALAAMRDRVNLPYFLDWLKDEGLLS